MDEEMSDIGHGQEEDECVIDFDYEFEAERYFDFCREESPVEMREAEGWFNSAETYPPSPFVVKLNLEGSLMENVNTSLKPKSAENMDSSTVLSNTCMSSEHYVPEYYHRGNVTALANNMQNIPGGPHSSMKGLTFYNHMAEDVPKTKDRTMKAYAARSSTLMRPTASQLAKQNPARPVHTFSQYLERRQKPYLRANERVMENIPMVENQAAKRQKLDGGHLFKVPEMKQQLDLIHKAPKKDPVSDSVVAHGRLKLTIPREPDLQTRNRVTRIRSKNNSESEKCMKPNTSMFRARPLNRKIFDAPTLPVLKKSTPYLPEFQEFHLKTSERAMQHSAAATLPTLPNNQFDKVASSTRMGSARTNSNIDSKRSNPIDAPKQEVSETMHRFKALPLNKKIFSSKGDIGVFRNSKREVTVPMEFNFSTDKRNQCNPPVDLFNKMSLTSELQQNAKHQLKLFCPSYVHTKGSKENIIIPFQQEHKVADSVQDKPQRFGAKAAKLNQCVISGEMGSRATMNRGLGIR